MTTNNIARATKIPETQYFARNAYASLTGWDGTKEAAPDVFNSDWGYCLDAPSCLPSGSTYKIENTCEGRFRLPVAACRYSDRDTA